MIARLITRLNRRRPVSMLLSDPRQVLAFVERDARTRRREAYAAKFALPVLRQRGKEVQS